MAFTELSHDRPATALRWQDIESRFSAVQPITCPVHPMRRHTWNSTQFEPSNADQLENLARIRNLLEWAYGYRLPIRAGQRFTRRAPSAGALYPTEIYVLVDGQPNWNALYYSFQRHAFFPVRDAHAAQAAMQLGLDQGSAGIVVVSILWRCIQRYGARGYRYCLLDAAAVCSNLLSGGGLDLTQYGPSKTLESVLDLTRQEAAMLALRFRPLDDGISLPSPPIPVSLPFGVEASAQHAPLLNPLLERTARFHRSTLQPHRSPISDIRLVQPVHGAAVHADERYSAKGFEPEAVPLEWLSSIAEILVSMPKLIRYSAIDLTIYLIVLRVADFASGVLRVPNGADERLFRVSSEDMRSLADRLCQACQGQSLVGDCAFAAVVTVPLVEIAHHCAVAYRHTVLNAGFISAGLYRVAAELGFGNTCIGGFNDSWIANLLGNPGIHPILVHAFGVARTAGEKNDEVKSPGKLTTNRLSAVSRRES
jgi:hypothetical protein